MKDEDSLWQVVKILPTDYSDYGGDVIRWENPNLNYPDCSSSCRHYRRLISEFYDDTEDADWGVCCNPQSPRAGLLTFEHQTGDGCWEIE